MNFADNWFRLLVLITFLSFREAQISEGIVPNQTIFSLFLGAIGYFALAGKMVKCSPEKTRINRYRSSGWSWKKIAGIYGISATNARRCSFA